jgi:hypothetical protein
MDVTLHKLNVQFMTGVRCLVDTTCLGRNTRVYNYTVTNIYSGVAIIPCCQHRARICVDKHMQMRYIHRSDKTDRFPFFVFHNSKW